MGTLVRTQKKYKGLFVNGECVHKHSVAFCHILMVYCYCIGTDILYVHSTRMVRVFCKYFCKCNTFGPGSVVDPVNRNNKPIDKSSSSG